METTTNTSKCPSRNARWRRQPLLAGLLALLAAAALPPAGASAQTLLDVASLVRNGALRVESEDGKVLLKHRDEEPFIPASVMKVITAYCALTKLGPDFHFSTDLFYSKTKRTVWVVGSGDPLLTSEEVERLAQETAERLRIHSNGTPPQLDRIVIDTTLFEPSIILDGYSQSLNPYDARSAAFVVNFSSANLARSAAGKVRSAEPQTPLTPIAAAAGRRLAKGTTSRINLGTDPAVGVRYGAELLAAFLRRQGVRGAMRGEVAVRDPKSQLLLRYRSSADLDSLVTGMLQYSTNFTANQLFLVLGAKRFGAPANAEKAQQAARECVAQHLLTQTDEHFHIEEGAGLSRRNQLSARQLTTILAAFESYRDLLPEDRGFRAKTGTLTCVNSLAGYMDIPHHARTRFAILINSNVPALYKFTVAEQVRQFLSASGS
jgi:D-alanyl-D-alanine carboxypeptidase/D-alanyl-D-alanine-endopeptidase (penicillin-binding protein 4)